MSVLELEWGVIPLVTGTPMRNSRADQKLIPDRSVPLKIAFVPSGPKKKTTLKIARLTRNTSPCFLRCCCR